jgi:hypothetical protein
MKMVKRLFLIVTTAFTVLYFNVAEVIVVSD